MNCWHCGTELIWGGDHDLEDMTDEYDMVTNLSCPNCGAYVEVYRAITSEKKQKEIWEDAKEPAYSPDAPWLDDAIDRVDPKKLES